MNVMKKMYIFGTYCLLSFFVLSRNSVRASEWVDELTRYAVEDADFKQVKFMSRLDDEQEPENYRVIDELYFKLIRSVPVVSIKFDKNFSLPPNSVADETSEAPTLIDTSATLFLFVIESRDNMTTSIVKSFVDAVAEMSSYHYTPKYLIVSIARKPSHHVRQLLQYAWSKKMLDFTIVELVEMEVRRGSISIQGLVNEPIIHKLNPFKNVYTREKWRAMKNPFFPNKLDNLWGYPVRVGVYINLDSLLLALYSTSAVTILSTIEKKLNFSSIPIIMEPSLGKNVGRDIQRQMELNNIDVSLVPYSELFNDWTETHKTVPIFSDELCAIVPLLSTWESLISSDVYLAHVLSVSILLIIWISTRVLRLDPRTWRMFNIFCLLLGLSVRRQPRDKIGRIVFACLLVLFAVYSSSICASITKITWRESFGTKIHSLDDLANSGLRVYIDKFDFARAGDLFDGGPFKNLQNQIHQIDTFADAVKDCFFYKNATCLMHKNIAKILFSTQFSAGSVKLIEPCFWTDHYSYIVGRRSPYRSKFDEIITRLLSSGIGYKSTQKLPKHNVNPDQHEDHTKKNNELLHGLILVGIVGYSLSFIVFICEITYHRVSMYIKSKVRPRPRV